MEFDILYYPIWKTHASYLKQSSDFSRPAEGTNHKMNVNQLKQIDCGRIVWFAINLDVK